MDGADAAQEGQREIDDAAFDLVSKASALAGQMNSIVTTAVGTVRCLTRRALAEDQPGYGLPWSMPYRWHPAGAERQVTVRVIPTSHAIDESGS